MALINVRYDRSISFLTQNYRRAEVGPGSVIGHFQLNPFVHELVSADMGYLRASLRFKDIGGIPCEYSSILGPLSLFPNADQKCKRIWQDFRPEFEVATVIDYGTDFQIDLDCGSKIVGRFSHTGIYYRVSVQSLGVIVELRVYVPSTMKDGTPGYETVYYDLPIERFLWRRAPRYEPDEIVWETEEFITLDTCKDMTDPDKRSAVRIV